MDAVDFPFRKLNAKVSYFIANLISVIASTFIVSKCVNSDEYDFLMTSLLHFFRFQAVHFQAAGH